MRSREHSQGRNYLRKYLKNSGSFLLSCSKRRADVSGCNSFSVDVKFWGGGVIKTGSKFFRPSYSPQVEWQLAAHPFIVEVKFSSTANVFVDSIRASCEASRIELLLNTLLGPAITHISGRMIGPHGNTWVVVPHVGETTQQHIAYCQQMYLCDEVKGGTEDFSSVQGILPLPEVPASDYDVQKTRHLGDPLNIPDDLGQSLDRFFSLTSKRQKQFMNACYWLSQANYTISYSTMFLTAIQAIEVLVETPRGGSSCDKCGKAPGPGRTKLFEEFLNKFAPDVSDEAGRGELYNTRSNLTHGFSPPFLIDRDVSGFSRPQVHQQSDLLGSALGTSPVMRFEIGSGRVKSNKREERDSPGNWPKASLTARH